MFEAIDYDKGQRKLSGREKLSFSRNKTPPRACFQRIKGEITTNKCLCFDAYEMKREGRKTAKRKCQQKRGIKDFENVSQHL